MGGSRLPVLQQQVLLPTFHILTSYSLIRDRLYIVCKFSDYLDVRLNLGGDSTIAYFILSKDNFYSTLMESQRNNLLV